MKFSELGLHPTVMAGVEENQFVDCTPIQEASIPHVLAGRDIAGLAQTGTGKTAAFALPLIDRILRSREGSEVSPEGTPAFKDWRANHYILVLVPTRELAEQVCENIKKLGKTANIRATSIYGGTGYEGQKAAVKDGLDFIVATPGRLIDLYKEHVIDLALVRAIVFDEADRMFDMGFKDDMKFILRRVPQDRQFLVFSATLNFDVLNTAYEFGANPIEVNVSKDQAKAENVSDEIMHVGNNEKPQFLLSLILKYKPKQMIVFSNFKHNVDRISKFLNANKIPAMGISSLISQNQRTRIMELFRNVNNDQNILVATDVAARGLDIKGVDMVINYELPDDAENYVHRIGRTGRAGEKGRAYSLVGDRDVEALQRIESYLGHKAVVHWLDEVDIVKDFKPLEYDDDRKRRDGPPRGRPDFKRDRPGHGGPRRPQGSHPQRSSGKGPSSYQGRDQNRVQVRDGQSRDGQRDGQQSGSGQGRPHDNRPGGNRSQVGYRGDKRHSGGQGPHKSRDGQSQQQFKNRNSNEPKKVVAGAQAKDGVQRPYQKRDPNKKRDFYRHRPHDSKRTAKPHAAGGWQAVTGFIKKIFGKDKPSA